MFRSSTMLFGVLFLAVSGVAAASRTYYLTDLGAMSGNGSYATAINSKGQVAGWGAVLLSDGSGQIEPFLWTGGQTTILAASPDGSVTMQYCNGLNDYGDIVGNSLTGTGVVYSNGTWTDLGSLGIQSVGAINDAGTIAGTANGHGFVLTKNGTMTELGVGDACGINSNGDVVGGDGGNLEGDGPAWYYSHTTGHLYELPGISGGYGAVMNAVNDSGQMTGMSTYGNGIDEFGVPRAGAYLSGAAGNCTDLGSLVPKSQQYYTEVTTMLVQGNSIAANGDIVGSMGFQNEGPYIPTGQHGFIYSAASNTVTDLNTLLDSSVPANWVITSATAIATITYPGHVGEEWIAADATPDGGITTDAVLLTPTPYTAPLAGDANLDGTVDINDLTIVLTNFGRSGMAWNEGDFNGNGNVDVNDLTIVLSNYGDTAGSPSPAAVPEPSALALLAAGAAALFAFGWWKR